MGRKAARPKEEKQANVVAPSCAPLLEPSLQTIDTLNADTLAVGIASDVRPLAGAAAYADWRLCGRLSQLLLDGTVTGAKGEQTLVAACGQIPVERVVLFGWGKQTELGDDVGKQMRWMVQTLELAKAKRICVALPEPCAALLPLVDEHLGQPLGKKLVGVFGPDPLLL